MDTSFILSLDYKFHRIRTVFLKKHTGTHALIPNFHKITVELSVNNLNSEGYSIDFGVIKNSIKALSEDFDGKILVCIDDNELNFDDQRDLLKILCSNGDVFELNRSSVLVLNGSHIGKEFEKLLAMRVHQAVKAISAQEEVNWVKVFVTDLMSGTSSSHFFDMKISNKCM